MRSVEEKRIRQIKVRAHARTFACTVFLSVERNGPRFGQYVQSYSGAMYALLGMEVAARTPVELLKVRRLQSSLFMPAITTLEAQR